MDNNNRNKAIRRLCEVIGYSFREEAIIWLQSVGDNISDYSACNDEDWAKNLLEHFLESLPFDKIAEEMSLFAGEHSRDL